MGNKVKIIFLIAMCFSVALHAITSNVVTDAKSGLMWQDNEDVSSVKLDWDSAVEYCQEFTLDGFEDWRLPSAEELLTITDKSLYDPAIKEEFNYIVSQKYWSSSSSAKDEIFAWSVDFKVGRTSAPKDKMSELFVRCTRTGQYNTLPFDSLLSKIYEENKDELVRERDESILSRADDENITAFEERVRKSRAIQRTLAVTWGKPIISDLEYDKKNFVFTANLSFEANKNFMKKVTIDIPSRYQRKFKSSIHTLNKEAVFNYYKDTVSLKGVKVIYYGRGYYLDIIEEDENELIVSSNVSNKFSEVGLKNFFELDNMLKGSRRAAIDDKKWLFVIGIENYEFTDCVTYAKRSAVLFAKSVQKKLGVSEQQSFIMTNDEATQSKIKNQLNEMLKKVRRGDTIYFYYNGHGMLAPDLDNEPFLLASDSIPKEVTKDSFFSVKNIYSRLSYSKATKIVTFIDSGFSCMSDPQFNSEKDGEVKIPVRFNQNKMVVLSATNGKGKANSYDIKAHRLFSYYVIKDIIGGKKHIKSFFRSIQDQVYDNSSEELGEEKAQEPSIRGNMRLTL